MNSKGGELAPGEIPKNKTFFNLSRNCSNALHGPSKESAAVVDDKAAQQWLSIPKALPLLGEFFRTEATLRYHVCRRGEKESLPRMPCGRPRSDSD